MLSSTGFVGKDEVSEWSDNMSSRQRLCQRLCRWRKGSKVSSVLLPRSCPNQPNGWPAPGGGDTDQFLSFSVPFSDVVTQLSLRGITIDEKSPLTYIMATATQDNSLNQDLNGVNGSINSGLTWKDLGVETELLTSTGTIPEPSTLFFMAMGFVYFF